MRVLGHIHSFNDEEVIDRSMAALLGQTRAPDAVLLVDNGSTDRTLERRFPEGVTVLRHAQNLGTSGAVVSGMRHALENGFDWIWILDADSAPRPDALAQLCAFVEGLPAAEADRLHRAFSVSVDASLGEAFHGWVLTDRGFERRRAGGGDDPFECLASIWSGSLFRLEAVRRVGLPRLDYVLDLAEIQYGYEAMRRGLRTWCVPRSIVDHNIDGRPSACVWKPVRALGLPFHVLECPEIRLYYIIRNDLYFWLHEFHGRGVRQTLRMLPSWAWIPKQMVKLALFRRWSELRCCVRAVRDGIAGRIERRY